MIPVDYEKGKEIAETCICGDCGAGVTLAWGGYWGINSYVIKCSKDIKHSRIARPASLGPYDIPGFNLFNLTKGRRKDMEQKYGPEKTRTLVKYAGTGAITKAIATEIVETLWGEAPLIEKTKCILTCQTYQLNPLMRHIHLIGYKRYKDRKLVVDDRGEPILDWSMQIGIGATRLLAQRKHNYSYLDLTPRKATQDEIDKILGDTADPGSIYGFTHIKDLDTTAEAFGLRGIEKNASIKGQDKGNTHLNMACIRSERLALDRQYPGEMPPNVEVMDERYIDAEYKVVEVKTDDTRGGGEVPTSIGGEKSGEPAGRKERGAGESGETISSPPEDKAQKIGASAARDPSTITNFKGLFQALWDDFRLYKSDALKELNVNSQEEITELPSECYQRIAAVRPS